MSYTANWFRIADRAAFWAALQVQMIAMGWELHDDISATVKVYKSNGESGNELYGYVWIDAGTSTDINILAYQYWDAAGHTGTRRVYITGIEASFKLSTFNATYDCIIAGDKDIVIVSYANSSGAQIAFGHLQGRIDTILTELTGAASLGAGATLPVTSTTGFGVGKYIQIVGITNEGCDLLQITEITDATNMKVANLPRNYASGSKIGGPASTFGVAPKYPQSATWRPVSFYNDAGTTVGALYSSIAKFAAPALDQQLSHFSKKYTLTPFFISNDAVAAPGILVGFIYRYFLYGIVVASNDAMIANNDNSFPTASTATSGGNTVLNDTAKSWTDDEHIGRFIVITAGTGIGQIRKITDNDGTSLTIGTAWVINPDNTSDYKICDTVYIFVANFLSNTNTGILITDTAVPA